MSRDARARLAAAQDRIVRVLLADEPIPPGFDPAQIHVARHVLRDKRARIAARRAGRPAPPRSRWQRLVARLRGPGRRAGHPAR